MRFGYQICVLKNIFLIALTETHLNDNISSCELTKEGWDIFRMDRHTRYGGGVAIYLKQSFIATDNFTVTTDMCKAIGLYLPLSNIAVINI